MNKIVNATDTLIPAPKDGQDGKPGQPGRPGTDGKPGPAGPSYYPAGKFDINREYERTSFQVPFVEHDSQYYYLNKVGKFKGIDPAKDYAANGKNATWVLGDKIKLAIIEAVVAEFGKIASAVFWNDFMLSQYGIDAEGKPVETADGYKAFTPGMDNFTPNILLNFLTGYAHFAHGNFAVQADGSGNICGKFLYWDKQGRLHRRREIIRDYVTQEDLADGIIGPDKGSFYSNRLISYAVRDTFTLSDPSKWKDEVLYIESHPITRSGTFIGVLPAKSGELKMYDKATKQYVDLTKAIANRGDGSTAMIVSRGSYWLLENADDFAVLK